MSRCRRVSDLELVARLSRMSVAQVCGSSARLADLSATRASLTQTAEQAPDCTPGPVHHAGPMRQATSGCTSDRP